MKTKLAILFAAALTVLSGVGQAQDKGKPAEPASNAAAAPAPAPGEVVELIQFEDTPLLDVIKTLARQAGINIILDPKIAGGAPEPAPGKAPAPPGTPTQPSVSIRLEHVTAQAALEEVLDNYSYVMVPNPKTGISRIKPKDKDALEPLVTKIYQLQYANPSNLVQTVKASLSTRSVVIPDGRTSQLVVTSTEKEFEPVENIIKSLDAVTKQVLIEARIYESSKNPKTDKGIDWTGTLAAQNFSFGNGITTGTTTTTTPGAPTTTTTTLPDGRTISTTTSGATTKQTVLNTLLGSGGLSVNTLGGVSPGMGFLNADGVKGVLSFLNTDSDTELLATPRAVTLDNQTASLSVTRAFPIFQQNPGSAQVAATTQIIYTNVGTILNVTPRISGNNNVMLKVVPEVSNIDSKDQQVINGQINQANVYASRRIEAQVLVPSGNTLVMGGLISDTTTKGNVKVPLLGDIPGIGLAFRKDSKSRSKSNMIMFITPTIVQDFDFQYESTDFLRTPVPVKPDVDESAWNSGKPYSWSGKKAGE